MRIYAKLRAMLLTNKDILLRLEKLENGVIKHDHDIKVVFGYIKELLNPKTEPLRKIGFRQKKD